MKYLSLFSGIGGFELGIQSIFPKAECVGFSEIDKYAIQTYRKHYPDHPCLGSISDINPLALPNFDMLVGGFPCQDLSIAKAGRKGLDGERSGLFWTMLSILRPKNPRYFCFENVASMPKKDRDVITAELGVEPVMINAALVSAQSRKRLFWCNWNVSQPQDRGILLKDILESGYEPKNKDKTLCIRARYGNDFSSNPKTAISRYEKGFTQIIADKSYCIPSTYHKENVKSLVQRKKTGLCVIDSEPPSAPIRLGNIGNSSSQGYRVYSIEGKSVTLGANGGGLGAKTGLYETSQTYIRKLTPTECERLQCFPDGYTEGMSNTQRYKQLGNAVNVEVVKHIMSELRGAL